ncbi:MAG: TetR/AcrR family transcriptional regulator [Clostridium sp.]
METTHDKKTDIIRAAIYLFSKKGFSSTSVQDIASYCNISKATIYKLFSSKEEILVCLIEHINKQMFINIESVDLQLGNDKLSTLEKKFTAFFENLYKRKNFNIMIYENQSLMKDPRFEDIFLKNRTFTLNWYKTILLDAFGKKIKPILWDLVIITAGIVKEFNYVFIIKEQLAHDFQELSSFMVKTLTAIIDSHYKDKPLVPPDLFEFFENRISIDKELLLDEWENKILEIHSILNDGKNICNKDDIFAATIEITAEIKKDHPKKFLIDSLLLYLGRFEVIETEVLFLRNLYLRADI